MARRGSRVSGVELAVTLRRAQLRKQLVCDTALAEFDMSLPQWGMLHAIAEHPDSSTHALAVVTGQSDQAAGAIVIRLAERSLLDRLPGPGKAIRHRLTAEGATLDEQCRGVIEAVMARLTQGLGQRELADLERYLNAIADAARAR